MAFIFYFIYGMSSFPLTNSYFSRWLLHHQPVITCYSEFSHLKLWFSIVMLVYHRVNLHFPMVFLWFSHFPMGIHDHRTTIVSCPGPLSGGRRMVTSLPQLRQCNCNSQLWLAGKCRNAKRMFFLAGKLGFNHRTEWWRLMFLSAGEILELNGRGWCFWLEMVDF